MSDMLVSDARRTGNLLTKKEEVGKAKKINTPINVVWSSELVTSLPKNDHTVVRVSDGIGLTGSV